MLRYALQRLHMQAKVAQATDGSESMEKQTTEKPLVCNSFKFDQIPSDRIEHLSTNPMNGRYLQIFGRNETEPIIIKDNVPTRQLSRQNTAEVRLLTSIADTA